MSEALAALAPKIKSVERRRVSLDAYFRAEEKSLEKNEYHNGIILKMAGGTFNHDSLSMKTGTLMNVFVEENNLDFFINGSDLKIRIEEYDKIVYSDALVICEKPIYFANRKDTIINPILIVEVLSDSTQNFDRTTKFEMYRTLPSFREYVLIHQDRKQVSVWTRQTDGTWNLKDYKGDDAVAILHHIHDCPLPLKRLYRNLVL
jgi:Uma2 family endonuclease